MEMPTPWSVHPDFRGLQEQRDHPVPVALADCKDPLAPWDRRARKEIRELRQRLPTTASLAGVRSALTRVGAKLAMRSIATRSTWRALRQCAWCSLWE